MATGRNLAVSFSGVLSAVYQRTDNALNANNIKDILSYTGLQDTLEDGQEADQADQLYHATRTFTAPGPENIDFDSDLTDIFGNTINAYAIKCIIIKNKSTVAGRYITVTIQDEVYYIGPGGWRMLWEPSKPGLQDSGASTAGAFGNFAISGSASVNYDLIVICTSASNNTTSSG